MLDIQRIRENPAAIRQMCARRNIALDIEHILSLDHRRREIISQVEQLKNLRNRASEEIALLKKRNAEVSERIAEMKRVAEEIKQKDTELRHIEDALREVMAQIPNAPHESVPRGTSAADNVEVARWGDPQPPLPGAKDHLTLGASLDILDFPRGAKIAGTGFPLYKGAGALLERALINFMLDLHTQRHGYREIFPPFLVNRASAFGTAQLPKSADQMYLITEDDLFCIPTAEVPVTNIHRDEILDERELPLRYCAYSACFRREAGSYGKDTRGFLRVHQFNKVELVKITVPEKSYEELETLRRDAEEVLQALKLPYRVMALCDADLSFAAAKCYDLEVWAPVEGRYLEASSCSNFEDFQARRMNMRYRPAGGGKPLFVHTLNGSGVATSRVMVALLETYQTPEGTVRVPDVLRPYMHGMEEIRR